jgi:hypothetical protein
VIHILHSRATKEQMDEMLEVLGVYVKLAVDIRRGILAGGGALHADCEASCLTKAAVRRISGGQTGFQPRSRYATKH